MPIALGFIVAVLQAALALLGFARANPSLPQAQRDQAVQVAQQAITTATQALANTQQLASDRPPVSTGTDLVITYPLIGTTFSAGQQMTIRWSIPSSVTSSFPPDFTLGLFLNLVRTDVSATDVYGINDGTNDPRAGSIVWKVPADIEPGTYKISAYLQAELKDPKRFCDPVRSVHKECIPSETDAAVMQRASRIKAESNWFTLGAGQNASIPAPGMSKYTDADFGFSFWYPSGWKVNNISESGNGMFAGTTDRAGNLSAGRIIVSGDSIEIDIDKVHSDQRTYHVNPGACGYCGPLTYFFDPTKHLWMKTYPQGPNGAPDATTEDIANAKNAQPADVSHNTMGGLHIFSTEQRENAAIIPLSARDFLYVDGVTYTEQCATHCADPSIKGDALFLVQTILATDPSVATPVSPAEQLKIIQLERDAYAITRE